MKKNIPMHILLPLELRRTKAIKPEVCRRKEIQSNRIKKQKNSRQKKNEAKSWSFEKPTKLKC